ncbi:hypothetical protein Glove_529g7 [Diversispora epigaea]|uniref:Uncharacterized protein n=1 Tax=Diversispora epigaea TaxID=1348612 RepID=A0A397GDN2_9GLOM|nr:hypothetical protein Glove_529g7 [Diversispora epigaea]
MTPKPFTIIQEMCNEFVTDFSCAFFRDKLEDGPIYTKLVHDGTWKESEESITNVTKEILDVLKDIWNNSDFSSEFAKTLTSLKNLPIGNSFFISTLKKQSVASANRKGDGFMGRCSDIMFIDDDIKLWRECNDGLFWVRQTLKLNKDQFGIVDVQIADNKLHLNLLVRDIRNIDDDIKLWRECNDGLFWVRQTLKLNKDQFGIVDVQIADNKLHLNLLVRDIRNVH